MSSDDRTPTIFRFSSGLKVGRRRGSVGIADVKTLSMHEITLFCLEATIEYCECRHDRYSKAAFIPLQMQNATSAQMLVENGYALQQMIYPYTYDQYVYAHYLYRKEYECCSV